MTGWKRRERKARQRVEQRRLAALAGDPLEPASFMQALMWYEKGDRTAVARFLARDRREREEQAVRMQERLRILAAEMAKPYLDVIGIDPAEADGPPR